jgi:hypothetical protein
MGSAARTVALGVGLILMVAGAALLLVTEPAGTPGSGASGGVADVSEEVRPYLIEAVVLLLVGVAVLAVGATMRP